ncbi:MAG: calcium-binding protein [Aliishimia sp.]
MAHITGTSFTLAHLEDRQFGLGTPDTANINGTQFVYLTNNINVGRDVRVFTVADDGSLTYVADVPDTATTALNGAWEMEIFTIGGSTFLATVSQDDDGLSIFELSDTAPYLVHVDTAFDSDNALYELNGARYLAVHQIGGNTFLTATSRNFFRGDGTFDNGITVFSVANDGSLTFASAFDPPAGTSIQNGWPSDTFEVNGSYYFAVGDPFASRFSIMEIDPVTGVLTAAVPNADLGQTNFKSSQIAVHTAAGVPYLFVPSDDTETLRVYTYDGGADVTLITSLSLPTYSKTPEVTAVYEVGDKIIVAVGSRGNEEGVLLYDFDTASGTLTELQWLPGTFSTDPDAQPLRDMSFGPSFTIAGQPYALITSDDDHTVNVYAIGGGDDVLSGTMVADLIEGYGGNDDLTGLAGDDVMRGFAGNDTLYGNRGDDEMHGGDGDDHMEGGLGADEMHGDAGDDVLLGFSGDDQIFGGEGVDTLKGGAGADVLEGNEGDDEIVGGDGNDTLSGQDGEDFMNAGAGNDVMNGGADNDRMFGGGGNDIMHGDGGDDLLKGNDGDDMITGGAGDDTISGQVGDDDLSGNAGNDEIMGGGGRDLINAGDGDDQLTGGSGADVFVFDTVATTGGGTNTITDFMDGIDLLDLSAYGYANATAALSGSVQDNADVSLTLNDGQIVFLENFLLTDLDGSDLILV